MLPPVVIPAPVEGTAVGAAAGRAPPVVGWTAPVWVPTGPVCAPVVPVCAPVAPVVWVTLGSP